MNGRAETREILKKVEELTGTPVEVIEDATGLQLATISRARNAVLNASVCMLDVRLKPNTPRHLMGITRTCARAARRRGSGTSGLPQWTAARPVRQRLRLEFTAQQVLIVFPA